MHGYAEFLEIIANRKHPEHASMMQWSGGNYDPDVFDPKRVIFEDPRKRWTTAFQR